jgi:hypothetical protein
MLTTTQFREARRRLLYLKKVLKVQTFYQENWVEGQTMAYVYREHIRDEFFISYICLQRYLGINARREIRQLESTLESHQSAQAY